MYKSLINTALLLWCIDSDSSNKEDYFNIEKKKKNKMLRVISKKELNGLMFMPYLVIFKYFQLLAFVLLFK